MAMYYEYELVEVDRSSIRKDILKELEREHPYKIMECWAAGKMYQYDKSTGKFYEKRQVPTSFAH
jgi:hypothetical protein